MKAVTLNVALSACAAAAVSRATTLRTTTCRRPLRTFALLRSSARIETRALPTFAVRSGSESMLMKKRRSFSCVPPADRRIPPL